MRVETKENEVIIDFEDGRRLIIGEDTIEATYVPSDERKGSSLTETQALFGENNEVHG